MDLSQVAEIIVVLKNGERVQYRGNGLEKFRKEMKLCTPLRPKPVVRVVEDDEPDTPLECEDGVCRVPQPDDEYEEAPVRSRKVVKTKKVRAPKVRPPPDEVYEEEIEVIDEPAIGGVRLAVGQPKLYHALSGLNYSVTPGNAQDAAREMQKQAAARGLSFA